MPRVPIGRMNQRVTIQRPTETQDALMQSVASWVDVATVYAAVETLDARETYQARQVNSLASHRVTIYYRDDLFAAGSKWQLVYRGKVLSIEGVVDPDQRRFQVVLTCSQKD